MTTIEEIVRPFTAPVLTSTGQFIIPSTTTANPVVLKWGTAGKMPKPLTDAVDFTLCHETIDETSRTSDDVRAENPNDSNQYIIYKRANSLKFDKTDNKAPVLASDFNIGLEQDFSAYNTPLGSFEPQDNSGSSLDHCKLTLNLKNK